MQTLRYIGIMLALVLLQVLVLNRIHLFNCATPLLYTYFVIQFPASTQHWEKLLLSFVLGLLIDTFSNTPGLASASLVLIAFIQPYMLQLMQDKEDDVNESPSVYSLGWLKFSTYAITLLLIYCLTFFSLEFMSYTHWMEWLMSFAGSLALTIVTVFVVNVFRKA